MSTPIFNEITNLLVPLNFKLTRETTLATTVAAYNWPMIVKHNEDNACGAYGICFNFFGLDLCLGYCFRRIRIDLAHVWSLFSSCKLSSQWGNMPELQLLSKWKEVSWAHSCEPKASYIHSNSVVVASKKWFHMVGHANPISHDGDGNLQHNHAGPCRKMLCSSFERKVGSKWKDT